MKTFEQWDIDEVERTIDFRRSERYHYMACRAVCVIASSELLPKDWTGKVVKDSGLCSH
jgi:hypothetical protein